MLPKDRQDTLPMNGKDVQLTDVQNPLPMDKKIPADRQDMLFMDGKMHYL